MPTGTQKLRDSTASILRLGDSIRGSVERIGQAQAMARAVDYLRNPPAEVQAIRDRAAFDAQWRDRAERERQKLRDMQAAAAKFYGRA